MLASLMQKYAFLSFLVFRKLQDLSFVLVYRTVFLMGLLLDGPWASRVRGPRGVDTPPPRASCGPTIRGFELELASVPEAPEIGCGSLWVKWDASCTSSEQNKVTLAHTSHEAQVIGRGRALTRVFFPILDSVMRLNPCAGRPERAAHRTHLPTSISREPSSG